MAVNGLLVSRSNVHELTSENILSFCTKEYWHKFILENGGSYDKELVLQAVLVSVSPCDLVPVKYTVEGKNSSFLARNCGQAIEKLCLNLLQPIELKDASQQIIISIQTCCLPIDEYKMNMQFYLKKAIEKRYNESQKGFINLSAFHKEPELYEVLFCPLSKPRFLVYVLSFLKRILAVTSINLSNNNIDMVKPLEYLQEFEGLVSLDLSDNQIKDTSLSQLLGKAAPALQELNLNNNPVCSSFKSELEYLKWIKEKNPTIQKLDGTYLHFGFPNHQVYLPSDKIRIVVNEFLKHFFTLYDTNRQALKETYDSRAIFSMTCSHLPSESSTNAKLDCYLNQSNTLLKVNNQNKAMRLIYYNNEAIVNLLTKLPSTRHDPFSFKVDVLYHKEPYLVLIVSGIFRDPQFRSFRRTFTLKKIGANEYKIVNDLYHVTNATPLEIECSFLHPVSIKEKRLISEEEEKKLIEMVSQVTEMNSIYSRKCLEESNWDLKKTLEKFLDNYEKFKIPAEAFSQVISSKV